MRILHSEAPPDYARYVFPYVVWGFLESGERPADALAAGFLPSSPDLDRFYLCRQIRIVLNRFRPSSENRRILRHGEGIACDLVEASQFEWSDRRREFCREYANRRWSTPPGEGRLDRIFTRPITSHVAVFSDPDGREVGLVSLLQDRTTWFYSNAFYEPQAPSGRGAFLMTTLVDRLSRQGASHLHLGTCYSRSALYKTQFEGVEFFDGVGWKDDLALLKLLLSREERGVAGHLLEDPAYVEQAFPDGIDHAVGGFGSR